MNEQVETTEPEVAAVSNGLMDGFKGTEKEAQDEADISVPHLEAAEEEAVETKEALERPDWFPEKFWNEDGFELEKMTKSYEELEKAFTQGKHKAPEKFDTKVLDDAGFSSEDPIVDAYLGWAKKFGLNQVAFDELAGTIAEIGGENTAQIQNDYETELKSLGKNANEIIQSNVNWSDGLLRKGVITDAQREEMNSWGGTAEGQRLLQTVRSLTGDMTPLPNIAVSEAAMTDSDFQDEIDTMMADPRYGSDAKFSNDVARKIYKRRGESFPG